LNILIVHPHIFAGGAEKVLLNLAYHLEKRNCKVDIATLTLDLSKLPSHLHRLHYIKPRNRESFPDKCSFTATLKSIYKETKLLSYQIKESVDNYDILNPHNFPAYWSAGLKNDGKPVVWHCNEVLGPYGQTKDLHDRSVIFRLTLRWAKKIDTLIVKRKIDKIVTCSHFNKRLIEERYGRKPEVVNTCVDYRFFSREVRNAKSRLGLDDVPLLLHVGALIQRKNQLVSLQALKLLKRKIDSIKLAVVGKGPWKHTLQKAAVNLHLERDVYFFGEVSEEDLRCLYHACDVNLYPVKDQTWGLVPFEALAAGKPSVVSQHCGAADIFSRKKLGVVVKPKAEELAEAAYFLLKNPSVTEEMVERGRRFVSENLTYRSYVEKILEIFKRALDSKP